MMKRLALIALALLWTAPASAQKMESRCYLFPEGKFLQVEATSSEKNFEIVVRDGRCRIFIRQTVSPINPDKRAGWLIDGRDGDILAEFWGSSKNGQPWEPGDIGLCSFRGGRFKTSQCPWSEWQAKAAQM